MNLVAAQLGFRGKDGLVMEPKAIIQKEEDVVIVENENEEDVVIIEAGVNKKHQKFIFEYRVFSQKLYLNMWCFEKVHICIPNMRYLHTKEIFRHILIVV